MLPLGGMNAVDVMTPYPQTVRPDALLADAAALMQRLHIRHLPVVDATATVVGMLSDRDLRTAVGDPIRFLAERKDWPYKVQDVMSRFVVIVPFDTPLDEVAQRFSHDRIGALPVVDRFGALLGILSYVDLLRLIAKAA